MKTVTFLCILNVSAYAQDSIFANYLKRFESDSLHLPETSLINLKGETVKISDYKVRFYILTSGRLGVALA